MAISSNQEDIFGDSLASAQTKNYDNDRTFKLAGIYGQDRAGSDDRSEDTEHLRAIFLFTTTRLSPIFPFPTF